MVQQAIEPQGDSKPAWKILSELARRICPQAERHLVDGICPGWDYTNTAEIMDEIAALTPIYAGVSHERLERGDSLVWPVESAQSPGTQTLFVSEFVHGRGIFMPVGGHPAAKPHKT
jgi:predicted molibdopterin-dependent oxidoreductase YjgC